MEDSVQKEKFLTKLKRLNPLKSRGKKGELETPPTSSPASTSTSTLPGILNPTVEAKAQPSSSVGSTHLSHNDISYEDSEAEHRLSSIEPQEYRGGENTGSNLGRTTWHGVRNVVEVVGEASDAFPPLKSVIMGISAILKACDQIQGNKIKSLSLMQRLETFDLRDPAEKDVKELARRSKLEKVLTQVHATLSRITEQNLLERAANNVQDNGELGSLVEDVRDALTDYQVSVQNDLQRMGRQTIEKADILILDKLPRAKGAGYLSGNHDKCLRGTRMDVLEEIWTWALNLEDARVYWLNGLAGSGKSTIAQSFSELCFAEGKLGASFFCSRDSADKSNIHLIFPTLAFQLAYCYPEFRVALVAAIASNSDIGHASLSVQLERLLLEPLKLSGISTIIVIDALDECKDEEATSSILSVLGRIVQEIPTVKIFITGRPEPRIRSGFRLPLLLPFTEVFHLHKVKSANVDDDIRTYLLARLPETILNRSDLEIAEPWPQEGDVAVLVRKCNGLFIFAATTYRFLASTLEDPRELLKEVVGLSGDTTHEGLTGIDAFYASIMEANVASNREKTQVLARLQMILGAVATVFDPLSRLSLAKLLGVTTSQIKTSFRNLHSVILVPDLDIELTKVYHKSFPDYLTDPNRCKDPTFYINPDVHHANIARKCLELMEKELKKNICGLSPYSMNRDVEDLSIRRGKCISGALEYACRFWAQHLRSCSSVGADDQLTLTLLKTFFEKHLLHWLEVLSILSELRVAVCCLDFLKEWLAKFHEADHDVSDLVNDAERYVLHSFDPMEESATHIYESSVFWLPSSSLVRKHHLKHCPTRVKALNAVDDSWNSCTRIIQAEASVISVCYSGSGKFIAATSSVQYANEKQGILWVFDAATGMRLMTVERSDGVLKHSTFSPDDALIIVGSSNHTVIAWDMQTGGLVRTYTGHTGYIVSVAVSHNGAMLASSSGDKSIRIWDLSTGNCTNVLEGHTDEITSICWSPTGQQLVSGSWDETVKLWNPLTGECLKIINAHENDRFMSVAYSPDSSLFASAPYHGTIKLYDSRTGDVLQAIPGATQVQSISFSSNSRQLLCSTRAAYSFVWDIEKQARVGDLKLDQVSTPCTAFSPDGATLVSGSYSDTNLRVWKFGASAQDPKTGSGYSGVSKMAHSPDGQLIIIGFNVGMIGVWDATTSSCLYTLYEHGGRITAIAISSDSALGVSGSDDMTVRIWNLHEGRQLLVLKGHDEDIINVQFFGSAWIISQSPTSVRLWDIETGELLATRTMDAFGTHSGLNGVQVVSHETESGASRWEIEDQYFDTSTALSNSVFFVPMQDIRLELHNRIAKPLQPYRYRLTQDVILDQYYRTISWVQGDGKWAWSDEATSGGDIRFELFPIIDMAESDLNQNWVLDGDGMRILWVPLSRRGQSSNWGKRLATWLGDGRLMTLDFSDV